MNFDNNRISATQLGSILLLTIVGTGILTLPRALAEAVGPDGWILILIGGIITIGLVLIHTYIVKSFPGKRYIEILSETLSKPVAYFLVALYVIYFIILNGSLVRIFSEVVKMFLLLRTPIEVIIFTILLVAAYLARSGIEALARMAELLVPLIFIPSIILFALATQGSDLTNLMPVLETSIEDLIAGIPTIVFSFLGFEILLIFGYYVNKPKQVMKKSSIAILVAMAIYSLLNIVTIAQFGVEQTVHLNWPTLSLFKTIEFPGLFIENVEAVVMGMWVMTVFMSIAPLLLVKVILLGDLFGARDNRFFALPLLPLLYFIALSADSMAAAYSYLDIFVNYTAPAVLLGVPILIIIVMKIKKTSKREGDANV
ncbi:GerAB/ArcD/ProY family transporter [Alkaliphilus transvaalensis]|uniref:GerAB/ArcD/ProY family transporter n=1 Tax=Alkaliphilus transvaalensis TaxID=114628 RepID=UPI00047BE3D7|nr:endospore germination permease [Alkaliphilus transvaalensis]